MRHAQCPFDVASDDATTIGNLFCTETHEGGRGGSWVHVQSVSPETQQEEKANDKNTTTVSYFSMRAMFVSGLGCTREVSMQPAVSFDSDRNTSSPFHVPKNVQKTWEQTF